ncbi:MAG TPA: hypothetical protein ENI27_05470 [bacterium]|nr:hypothetical protein [bacterium]
MRNDFNSVLIEGTLTDDPVISYDTKGSPVTHFMLACMRNHTHHVEEGEEPKAEISYFWHSNIWPTGGSQQRISSRRPM